ncbi:hypothetical protein [Agrobacterium cavarae]
MYYERCLAEIQRRLSLILAERDLQMCLEGSEEFMVFFERTDEKGIEWRSPLNFIFADPKRTKLEEAWFDGHAVALGDGRSEAHPVGTTGWIHFEGGWSQNVLDVGDRHALKNWDEAFEYAARVLLEDPLVPTENALWKIVDGPDMHFFWLELEGLAHERGIEEVDVGRISPFEEFFELKYRGATFRLVFSDERPMRVFRDEVELQTKRYYECGASQREVVSKHLDKLDRKLDAGREP